MVLEGQECLQGEGGKVKLQLPQVLTDRSTPEPVNTDAAAVEVKLQQQDDSDGDAQHKVQSEAVRDNPNKQESPVKNELTEISEISEPRSESDNNCEKSANGDNREIAIGNIEEVTASEHGEEVRASEHDEEVTASEHGAEVTASKHGEEVTASKHDEEVMACENGEEKEQVVSLAQQFIKLGMPLDCEILDVACGTGVVSEECRLAGYKTIDGLDPCQAYLDGGMEKGIFRRTFKEFIDPDRPTSIPDSSYDAILCCAGFFQGLISPRGFRELIRITRKGGVMVWNIAAEYQHIDKDYARYDDIVMGLVREKAWVFDKPVIRHEKMAFTDCGHAYLRGFQTDGGIQCEGYTYIMRKL